MTTHRQDEESLQELVAAFTTSFNKLDAYALSMAFHEDADFTTVRGTSVHGRQAIEEWHRPLFEGDGSRGTPSFKHAPLRLQSTRVRFIRPDVAFLDITWTQTGAVLTGKDMGPREGLLMWVVTRELGEWRISVYHNMDLPLPFAPPRVE